MVADDRTPKFRGPYRDEYLSADQKFTIPETLKGSKPPGLLGPHRQAKKDYAGCFPDS